MKILNIWRNTIALFEIKHCDKIKYLKSLRVCQAYIIEVQINIFVYIYELLFSDYCITNTYLKTFWLKTFARHIYLDFEIFQEAERKKIKKITCRTNKNRTNKSLCPERQRNIQSKKKHICVQILHTY